MLKKTAADFLANHWAGLLVYENVDQLHSTLRDKNEREGFLIILPAALGNDVHTSGVHLSDEDFERVWTLALNGGPYVDYK